jgi:hypothetical protein
VFLDIVSRKINNFNKMSNERNRASAYDRVVANCRARTVPVYDYWPEKVRRSQYRRIEINKETDNRRWKQLRSQIESGLGKVVINPGNAHIVAMIRVLLVTSWTNSVETDLHVNLGKAYLPVAGDLASLLKLAIERGEIALRNSTHVDKCQKELKSGDTNWCHCGLLEGGEIWYDND